MDTVLTVEHIPVDDKVWVDSKVKFVGGQAANAAQGMARLGLQVSFLTRLGDDDDGAWAKDHYRNEGMDTSHCIVVPGCQTMSACATIGTAAMTRTIFMHRDMAMFDHSVQARLDRIDLDAFDVVYTDGHQMDLALPVVRRAFERGMPVVSDIEVLDYDTRELFRLSSDVIAPALSMQELAGVSDPGAAAVALAGEPGKVVVATCGEHGSHGASCGDEAAEFVPAHTKCKATDTLGAGDAYHAGYLAALARGLPSLRERMEFATTVAAALCETPGPVVSLEALARYGIVPKKTSNA